MIAEIRPLLVFAFVLALTTVFGSARSAQAAGAINFPPHKHLAILSSPSRLITLKLLPLCSSPPLPFHKNRLNASSEKSNWMPGPWIN